MNILAINSGSTSVKYGVYRIADLKEVASGTIAGLQPHTKKYERALGSILKKVQRYDIVATGHRYVHGGDVFTETTKVTKSVIKKLKALDELAPLHNPQNRFALMFFMKYYPGADHFAIFDTSFHATVPEKRYRYAIPRNIEKKFNIRRYGFHGISHENALNFACEKLQKSPRQTSIISFHLGGGSSITATEKGRSVYTSMGFSPLSGLVMATRSGDIDPAIITTMAKQKGYSIQKIEDILNFKSGVLALSGTTNFEQILAKAARGSKRHELAREVFIESIFQHAAYALSALPKVDALVFTGGIGYGSSYIRRRISGHHLFKSIPVFSTEAHESRMIAEVVSKRVH